MRSRKSWPGPFTLLLTLAIALMLTACGSTKVYNTDKTMVFRGTMYNLSTVQAFSTRIEATLPGGETRDVSNADKSTIESLLDQHNQFSAKSFIIMDQQNVLYEARIIDRYKDFSKMANNLEGAGKDISKFMAHKSKTQLTLK